MKRKARSYSSPEIQKLLDQITSEEYFKISMQMRSLSRIEDIKKILKLINL